MKRRNLKRWQESRLRRLQYKLDHMPDALTPERIRCELREVELKRALWTGWQANAPSLPRSAWKQVSDRFSASIRAQQSNPNTR